MKRPIGFVLALMLGAAPMLWAQASSGNIYYGLWYPIVVAAVTLVIGTLFLKETKDHKVRVDL